MVNAHSRLSAEWLEPAPSASASTLAHWLRSVQPVRVQLLSLFSFLLSKSLSSPPISPIPLALWLARASFQFCSLPRRHHHPQPRALSTSSLAQPLTLSAPRARSGHRAHPGPCRRHCSGPGPGPCLRPSDVPSRLVLKDPSSASLSPGNSEV